MHTLDDAFKKAALKTALGDLHEDQESESVCMKINDTIMTNMVGSTELKNTETTFTFLH